MKLFQTIDDLLARDHEGVIFCTTCWFVMINWMTCC